MPTLQNEDEFIVLAMAIVTLGDKVIDYGDPYNPRLRKYTVSHELALRLDYSVQNDPIVSTSQDKFCRTGHNCPSINRKESPVV